MLQHSQPFFKLLSMLVEFVGGPPGMPPYTHFVLQRLWEVSHLTLQQYLLSVFHSSPCFLYWKTNPSWIVVKCRSEGNTIYYLDRWSVTFQGLSLQPTRAFSHICSFLINPFYNSTRHWTTETWNWWSVCEENVLDCVPLFRCLLLLSFGVSFNCSVSPVCAVSVISRQLFMIIHWPSLFDQQLTKIAPHPCLEWLTTQVTRNKLAAGWTLDQMSGWVEHYLIAHNNVRVRNGKLVQTCQSSASVWVIAMSEFAIVSR